MRLSTPPRLSASFQILVRATAATASSSLPSEERDHAAEVPHLAGGDLVARVRREARVEDPLDTRVALEVRGDDRGVLAVAVHPDCERLRAAEDEPGVEGARTAPSDFWRNASRSASASSLVATKPPTTSEWPPRYFVVECRARSAPSSSGRWR